MAKKRASATEQSDAGNDPLAEELLAHLDAPRQLPADWPNIPQIVVRREWPYFNENEDTESIDSVVSAVITLWDRMRDSDTAIDDPEFFGENVDYLVKGEQSFWRCGDARPAIANYEYLKEYCRSLLAKPCWEGVKTFPPVSVIAVLFDQELGCPDYDAINVVRFQKDNALAIKIMERHRTEAVDVIRPTMALFFASLTVAGLMPSRDDNGKKTENSLPQNGDVSELCRHLKAKAEKFGSEAECARDFCRKNRIEETKASNLLRQARRFGHLWKR